MDHDERTRPEPTPPEEPRRIRLPGFITDHEVGLGDAVARVTRAAGIASCGSCRRRAAALNRWMVFTGPRR